MVERKALVAILLIVITFSVSGYIVGQFLTSSGETVTVTSSTTMTEVQTITTTSTSKITETVTLTTNISGDLMIPSPANSSAIIRGRLLYDGTIFVTFSIDKPIYSIGEIVHIKSTITNLSPNNKHFWIGDSSDPMIRVGNSTHIWTWLYPEFAYAFSFFPLPPSYIELSPGETKTIAWMTSDWNMKGLHHSSGNVMDYWLPWNSTGISLIGNFYNDYFVSEGQYTVTWTTLADLGDTRIEIPFTITKQD